MNFEKVKMHCNVLIRWQWTPSTTRRTCSSLTRPSTSSASARKRSGTSTRCAHCSSSNRVNCNTNLYFHLCKFIYLCVKQESEVLYISLQTFDGKNGGLHFASNLNAKKEKEKNEHVHCLQTKMKFTSTQNLAQL